MNSVKEITTDNIEEELQKRLRENPAEFFIPNEKVEGFINMVGSDKSFINFFSAGNGVGKTCGVVNMLANIFWPTKNKWFGEKEFDWEFYRDQVGLDKQEGHRIKTDLPLFKDFPYRKRGRIVSDPKNIEANLIPELEKWFPKGKYKTKKGGKQFASIWQTDTGHMFDIMTYEQSPKEFESATLGWCWFDEPPPIAIFKATVARMRKGGIIIISATPLAGSAWLYDHIICYKPKKTGNLNDEKQRDFLYADVEDNCMQHGVRGILTHEHIQKMIEEYSEDDRQAREHGLFHHLTGLVFKSFNIKIHVIKPFQVNKMDYSVWQALDPHDRNPDAVLWVAIDKKGRKIIVDELYKTGTTAELSKRIKRIDREYRIDKRIIDPSAFDEDQHEEEKEKKTLAAVLYNKYGLSYQKGSKKRTQANREIRDALDYVQVGDEIIVAPDLYIVDTNVRIIFELLHYQWDDWRGKAAERKDPSERPMDKDDHMLENLGRIMIEKPKWIPAPLESGSGVYVGEIKDDPYD